MGMPSVLIVTTTYEGKDYCLDEFLGKAKKIRYPNFRHIFLDNSRNKNYYYKLKNMGLDAFHIKRGGTSREAIARALNFARDLAIKDKYDYMLILESDIMHPPTVIYELMKWGKDVVTGLYFIGDRSKGVRVPCVMLPQFNQELGVYGTRLLKVEEFQEFIHKGLRQTQAGGFGCCLINRETFNRFIFFFDPRFAGHPDIYFFNDCWKNSIRVWVNTDMVLDHKNSNWSDVKDR